MGEKDPWLVGTGGHNCWKRYLWRLNLGWQPWMLSRFANGSSSGAFLRVNRLMDVKLDLGPALVVSLIEVLGGGGLGKQPSLLRPSWGPQHHRGGYKGSTVKVSWVVAVIGRHFDDTSVIICSPDWLCVCNDEDKLWACKKYTPRLKGRKGRMLTKLISFCEIYDGLVLYFITNSYLLLACFSVGFLYLIAQIWYSWFWPITPPKTL